MKHELQAVSVGVVLLRVLEELGARSVVGCEVLARLVSSSVRVILEDGSLVLSEVLVSVGELSSIASVVVEGV